MKRKEFKIWLAGFVDGEGYIGTFPQRGTSSGSIRLVIVNTNKNVLHNINKFYHGRIYARKKQNNKWKTSYTFENCANSTYKILKDIIPYLQIKQKQATLTLKIHKINNKLNNSNLFGKSAYKKRYSKTNIYKRNQKTKLMEQIKKLNKRGNLHPQRKL